MDEIKEKIKYLENKLECCSCSKEELYELEDLKDELNYLESVENDEKENN